MARILIIIRLTVRLHTFIIGFHPIASKDSLDETSSPSVAQRLRTGSCPFGFTPCLNTITLIKQRIHRLIVIDERNRLCKNRCDRKDAKLVKLLFFRNGNRVRNNDLVIG